jgi:hypothetical protein
LLEQGAEETVVLQGSHVGIRKKSAGIFSERDAKGTDAGQPFVYRVNLLRWKCVISNTEKQLWERGCGRIGRDKQQLSWVKGRFGEQGGAHRGIGFV